MKARDVKKLYPLTFIIILLVVMGSMVGLTENYTRAELESRQDGEILEMIQEIFPDASYYTFDEDIEVFTVYNSGRRVIGHAFYGQHWGYRGLIHVLVGLIDKETIKDIVVVSQYEDWSYWHRIERENFFDQFAGLKIEDCYLDRRIFGNPVGEVNNVTGSTVSASAVVEAVRRAAIEKVGLIW